MEKVLVRDKGSIFVGRKSSVSCGPAAEEAAVLSEPESFALWESHVSDFDGYRRFGKRVIDLVLVLGSAPIALPIIALCALALWIESGLPFYRQTRLGRDGRAFSILKLRTMVRDAETMLAYHLDAAFMLADRRFSAAIRRIVCRHFQSAHSNAFVTQRSFGCDQLVRLYLGDYEGACLCRFAWILP